MALICNIGAAGKALRLKIGIVLVSVGIILGLMMVFGILSSPIFWLPVTGSILGGAFSMWEARAGWCIVRAMGIRTSI
jgi:hypothetical protein|tara:strand:- start:1548 stop:1781 length:234 start_codon:yes stop_codon:yes gene_type:complete